MPFWKKSEDPWDWEPKRQTSPRETGPETGDGGSGLLDELRNDFQNWNQERKEKSASGRRPRSPFPAPGAGRKWRWGIWWADGTPSVWYASAPAV